MSMNIKDPAVHAMARELAAHKGTTVTDAVRQALKAELERVGVCLDVSGCRATGAAADGAAAAVSALALA